MTVQNRALASAFTQRAIFLGPGAVFVWHSVADRGARSSPDGPRPADLEPRSGPARWTRPADRRTDRHRPRSTDRRSPIAEIGHDPAHTNPIAHARATRIADLERLHAARGSRTEDHAPRTKTGHAQVDHLDNSRARPGHDQGKEFAELQHAARALFRRTCEIERLIEHQKSAAAARYRIASAIREDRGPWPAAQHHPIATLEHTQGDDRRDERSSTRPSRCDPIPTRPGALDDRPLEVPHELHQNEKGPHMAGPFRIDERPTSRC